MQGLLSPGERQLERLRTGRSSGSVFECFIGRGRHKMGSRSPTRGFKCKNPVAVEALKSTKTSANGFVRGKFLKWKLQIGAKP